MRRKPRPVFRYVLVLGTIAIAITAYFYNAEGYSFFMRTYYEKVLGMSVEQQVREAEVMYDNRRYAELKEYLHPRILVYPDTMAFKKLDGLARIKLGEPVKGIDMLLTAAGSERMPVKLLEETVGQLFEMKRYRDIIELFTINDPGGNPNLHYQYGIALFETGNMAGAVRELNLAIDEGRTDYEAYHYLGRAHAKSGNIRLALPHLEHAHSLNEDDPDVTRSLADAYRALGRYNEAARLLRSIRR
ncbi:MAG TPA: tetratricopeptide repeat protein [Spirochaetota bacterium]|mgnify:CR=1 FL=1|nr:tetratricopeptide repeat protein [Spirochaetota bacterium]HOD15956.1 tetratricopeptide repeat protein [Spirochaetota bacterium]HPG51983.1 tetratricopeptide repeat protein [Spirochaetota bacterium]HPN13782.1 tetratricopeptide repeat protein [Spirochaetota bacterium]HQL82872.1 tetratricopeptide repeat protein [Spirochaetota bacterium]